jgi:hypothetical protein
MIYFSTIRCKFRVPPYNKASQSGLCMLSPFLISPASTPLDGLDDLSGIGARAGVNIEFNPRTYLGVGAIYVDYISCDEATYVDCSESYPELTLNFIF